MAKNMGKLTSEKAKKILEDKSVRGHPLSSKQKRFFGLIAGGGKATRLAKRAEEMKKG